MTAGSTTGNINPVDGTVAFMITELLVVVVGDVIAVAI
jgi:hypothetical protein